MHNLNSTVHSAQFYAGLFKKGAGKKVEAPGLPGEKKKCDSSSGIQRGIERNLSPYFERWGNPIEL